MLIVLEGCDGSGKSTIANNLKNLMPDAEVIHCTASTPNDMKFFTDIIKAADCRNIIADRFCYGQFIYQKEHERKLSRRDLTDLEVLMLEHGVKVVHVTAPVRTIEDRLKLRHEKTPLSVNEITQRYIDLFENSLMRPSLWWTGGDD